MGRMLIVKTPRPEELPAWLQPVPGFCFTNGDGDPCSVLGWGAHYEAKMVSVSTPFGTLTGDRLRVQPCSLLYARHRKGTWFIEDVMASDLAGAVAGWSEAARAQLSGWGEEEEPQQAITGGE